MPARRRLIDLPPCETNRLGDIADLVTSALSSCSRREKLALAMKRKGYIPKLLELFQACEQSETTEALHQLYGIMRGILHLGKSSLFEVMFSKECIMDVIGCLEYDPSLAQPKHHRQFATKRANLKKIVPIRDSKIQKKFHQMYQAQYIQANFLPNPDFGENYPSNLTSFIRRKKEEIFRVLEKDEEFLSDVFVQLTNEATAEDERLELVNFLKELCASSLMFYQRREKFLQRSAKLGILPTLEILIGMNDLQVRAAATDILSDLADFSPFMVQEFVMKEAQRSDLDTDLISVVIEQLICHSDPESGGAEQLMDVLCTLLDPGNLLRAAEAPQVSEFLNFFYTCCIPVLTAPLLANAGEGTLEIDDYQVAKLLALILKLLTFCVEWHKEHMRHYIISRDLLRRVPVLMNSKHTFLALSAFKFIRKIIGLRDEHYNCYMARGNLLEPFLLAVLENGAVYHLLTSAVFELLEFIRLEDGKSLIGHLVEKFCQALGTIDYVQTFGLKPKYEKEKHQQEQKVNSVPCRGCSSKKKTPRPAVAAPKRRLRADCSDHEDQCNTVKRKRPRQR
ncbi:PREDICTED: serine/threonine-protein phosphatase 4 regulatory subunit 3B-like [Lepidothrix coronata]|uniref:Serine/threonine-protein phosphatase 4 regulatory subunit 3B-like n=1 Tax=Lepidothrix coronata TaxID=321398 RepID=A0A6J0HS78_9PASS|nr:PREDICTED: serine/threonine-protein phosphatase 4 regulatory subunit 3B-like [Lepidothrix coronata]